jgi:NitT/TauT family transport system permease protein
MTLFGRRIPMMAALLVWVALWEVVGRFDLLMLFPPFSEVLAALGEVVTSRSFASAMTITVYAYLAGLALALVVGIPLGFLMGTVPAADRMLNMWVNTFLSAPLSALVPIFMILFGLGTPTVIVTVFMFAVWIIVLDTRAGVQHVAPSLVEMSRAFGAGLRRGLIRGVLGLVSGLRLVSFLGVGALFALYQQNFLMAHFWALILLLFACALLLAALVARLEKRIEYYAGART